MLPVMSDLQDLPQNGPSRRPSTERLIVGPVTSGFGFVLCPAECTTCRSTALSSGNVFTLATQVSHYPNRATASGHSYSRGEVIVAHELPQPRLRRQSQPALVAA